MNTKEEELNELKRIIKIDDFRNVSIEDIVNIDKMAAKGKLTPQQMGLLVAAIPHFIDLQKQTIQALQDIVSAVRDIQKEAIYAVSKSLDAVARILEQLAGSVQTDEAKMQIASNAIEVGRLGVEVAKIIESMNKDNNNIWKYITGALILGSAIIVIYIFAGRSGSDGT